MDFTALAQGMNQAVPFAGHVGVTIESIEPGACIVTLPDEGHLKNHVGSQHAGALFTAAEAASGGAFLGAFAERMGELRPLVRDAQIEYTRVARGVITARARFEAPVEEVAAALDADGRADFVVLVSLVDEGDAEVASMRVRWNVKVLAPAAA